MQLDMSPEEWALLRDVLDTCLQDLRSEMHHTGTAEYKHELRQRNDVLGRLLNRLQQQQVGAAA